VDVSSVCLVYLGFTYLVVMVSWKIILDGVSNITNLFFLILKLVRLCFCLTRLIFFGSSFTEHLFLFIIPKNCGVGSLKIHCSPNSHFWVVRCHAGTYSLCFCLTRLIFFGSSFTEHLFLFIIPKNCGVGSLKIHCSPNSHFWVVRCHAGTYSLCWSLDKWLLRKIACIFHRSWN
jgi:hypothetical protein